MGSGVMSVKNLFAGELYFTAQGFLPGSNTTTWPRVVSTYDLEPASYHRKWCNCGQLAMLPSLEEHREMRECANPRVVVAAAAAAAVIPRSTRANSALVITFLVRVSVTCG